VQGNFSIIVLELKAAQSFKMQVTSLQWTRHDSAEDLNSHHHHCDNPKSRNVHRVLLVTHKNNSALSTVQRDGCKTESCLRAQTKVFLWPNYSVEMKTW